MRRNEKRNGLQWSSRRGGKCIGYAEGATNFMPMIRIVARRNTLQYAPFKKIPSFFTGCVSAFMRHWKQIDYTSRRVIIVPILFVLLGKF
jgi:hypothetical protein